MKAEVKIHSHGDETAALTSSKGHVRSFARLSQTEIPALFARWVQAELERPGANPVDIMHGFARFCVQTQASLAASFLDAGGMSPSMDAYKAVIDIEFPAVFLMAKRIGEQAG